MVDRSAIVKELTTVGKFLSSDKLSGSKGSSRSGSGQPTMLAPHYGGMGGAAALHDVSVGRSVSVQRLRRLAGVSPRVGGL